jgi:hypothetical protein
MAGVREPLRGSRKREFDLRGGPKLGARTLITPATRSPRSEVDVRSRARSDELLWISAPGARLREDEKWSGERSSCRSASRSRSPSTDRPGAVAHESVRAIRLRDARTAPHDLHSPCVRPRGGLRGPSPKGAGDCTTQVGERTSARANARVLARHLPGATARRLRRLGRSAHATPPRYAQDRAS